jgi:hypothetical protein
MYPAAAGIPRALTPVPISHRPSRVIFVSKIEKADGQPLDDFHV